MYNVISVLWVAAIEGITHSTPGWEEKRLELSFTHRQQARKESLTPWDLLTSKAWRIQSLEEPIQLPWKDLGAKRPLWSSVDQAPALTRDNLVLTSGCSCTKQESLKRPEQFIRAYFYESTPLEVVSRIQETIFKCWFCNQLNIQFSKWQVKNCFIHYFLTK